MTNITNSIKMCLVIFCTLALNSISFAQNKENYLHTNELDPTSENNKKLFNSQLEELTGTFQFIITKENYSVILNKDLLNQIEAERLPELDTSIIIDAFTTLYIASESKINAPSFVNLPITKYAIEGTLLNTINEEN